MLTLSELAKDLHQGWYSLRKFCSSAHSLNAKKNTGDTIRLHLDCGIIEKKIYITHILINWLVFHVVLTSFLYYIFITLTNLPTKQIVMIFFLLNFFPVYSFIIHVLFRVCLWKSKLFDHFYIHIFQNLYENFFLSISMWRQFTQSWCWNSVLTLDYNTPTDHICPLLDTCPSKIFHYYRDLLNNR